MLRFRKTHPTRKYSIFRFGIAFFTLIYSASIFAVEPSSLNLIPLPAAVTTSTGSFSPDARTVIVAAASFTNEAALLADELKLKSSASAATNRILLTTQRAEKSGDEEYSLETDSNGVTIHARSAAGAFYGCQTLRQLIDPVTHQIPFIRIEDSPRYVWRGLLLDVSRHFFGPTEVRQVIDWMAGYKLNRLHLHLTDDQGWRLQINQYPELTATGARGNYSGSNAPARFYTQAEMRSLIAYAAQRHIVIVPEIDMPGHAGAAIRTFPQLNGGDNTYNPAREPTYDFLQNVLLEVMNVFPSPWIHIGGDEVNVAVWKKDPEIQKAIHAGGLSNPEQLKNRMVNRMAAFIKDHGRTPMGWDEISDGAPVAGTVIFWWRHDKPESLARALEAGYPVVLTPRAPCYFDYPQNTNYPGFGWKIYNTPSEVYEGPAIPENISVNERRQILGVEGCIWTERIATLSRLEFTALPRLAALAEMTWTPDNRRNYKQFDTRLQPFLAGYKKLGIHYFDETDPASSMKESYSEDIPQLTAD
jgi:hexosaminidase